MPADVGAAQSIRFGTDGWRAIIADGFTFDTVRLVADAIGATCIDLGRGAGAVSLPATVDPRTLVVGYDRRFLSREFAGEVAARLARAGFRVLLSNAPTPSQTISFTAKHRNILGGVVVTASHNPAIYNGIKFKGWYGGSALPEIYASIARNVGRGEERDGGSIEEIDLLEDYIEGMRRHLDVELIRRSPLAILHDPIHGVAAGIPARVFGEGGRVRIETIRGEVNPSFGGVNPEPIPENLVFAQKRLIEGKFDLAICNDGDSDRLGIVDDQGVFVSPHRLIALIALYLVRTKGRSGEIVKTFSTSRLLEKVARALGMPLHETAIGFKYVADLMLTRDILIGGEESGGIGFGSFLPERDGILSGLLVAEVVAAYGKPLSQIVREMDGEFGTLHYDRRDLHRPRAACERLIDEARSGRLDSAFGLPFRDREEVDGVKLNFSDGSWLLFRLSGTEPMIRIYCESPDRDRVTAMLDRAAKELDREG